MSVRSGNCQGIYKLKPNCYEIELEELGTIEDAGRGICRRDDSLCTGRMESMLRDFLQTFGQTNRQSLYAGTYAGIVSFAD